MRPTDRRGLVLVELATLVGVGFVSLAMMLPQIFGAREAARRAQCTNNLKQIGLALHNYHDSIGTFPMSHVLGKTKDDGRGNGQSGFALILPYLEEAAVYNAYNFALENWHESNATAVGVRMKVYLCPSNEVRDAVPATMIKDHHDKAFGGKNKFERGHYGMNWGGVRKASGAEIQKAYGESWRGVMMTVVDPDTKTSQVVGIKDILDGTSNTVAVTEKLDSFGWAVGGWGGSEFDVNLTPVDPGKGDMERRVFTGSMHPNGMNVLMCDGAVRFITGKTEAGVWRKLTTRAGGEVIGPDDIK